MKKEKKEKYESPQTRKTQVNLESGFMSSASVFEDGTKNAEGVTIEEHGFANPTNPDGSTNYWEGDYSGSNWD